MSVTISFELPPGTPTDLRQFPKNTEMKIHGDVTYGGFPVVNCNVEIIIQGTGISLYHTTSTTIMGNYEWIFVTPNVDARADVTVIAYYWPASSGDRRSVPISFGNVSPAPVTTPLSWQTILMYSAVGLGAAMVLSSLLKNRRP